MISAMKATHLILLMAILALLWPSSQACGMTNCDFSNTTCPLQKCKFNAHSYLGSYIDGWIPDDQIEIGLGKLYSDFLSTQRVINLAPSKNSCIRQYIPNLAYGAYDLQLNWGANKGIQAPDCQLSVHFNGECIGTYKPNDYQPQATTIQIKLPTGIDYAQIKFCGSNAIGSLNGIFIQRIDLIKKTVGSLTFDTNRAASTYSDIRNQIAIKPIELNLLAMPSVFLLDSHCFSCYQRQHQLQAGWHQLKFNYKSIFTGSVHESYISVKFNGQVIAKIYPRDCDSHDFVVQVKGVQGINTVQFCPTGCPGQLFYKTVIKGLCVNYKPCLGKQYEDLIVNGGFQKNTCGSSYCIWNNATIPLNGVPGWIPTPEIEIGRGSLYNNVLGDSWVSQLDPNVNTCIRQKLLLKSGKHTLKFDWAARVGIALTSNAFTVKVNDQVIRAIAPLDYNLHKQETVQFTLSNPPLESYVALCGTGGSDSNGVLIDNVKLFYLDQCSQVNSGRMFSLPTMPTMPTMPTLTNPFSSLIPRW